MYESILGDLSELSYLNMFYIAITALLGGILLSIAYIISHKDKRDNSGFSTTILILPIVVAFIINLVASDIARAFSLAGVFALIRFRSEPGESKDITYILTASGIGLASGLGYISLGITISVVMAIIFITLHFIKFGYSSKSLKKLKIVVPEDLNYQGVFDETLEKFCTSFSLEKIKTSDFGSLFELSYYIHLKDNKSTKWFIDEIRMLNGNLDVSIVMLDSTCHF